MWTFVCVYVFVCECALCACLWVCLCVHICVVYACMHASECIFIYLNNIFSFHFFQLLASIGNKLRNLIGCQVYLLPCYLFGQPDNQSVGFQHILPLRTQWHIHCPACKHIRLFLEMNNWYNILLDYVI